MRVAFLTHEPFYPPSGGGSAEALYLVREFVRRGYDLHLFGPDFENRESVAREFGIQIHPFTRWKMGRYTPARNLKYLLYPGALTAWVVEVLQQQRATRPGFAYDLLFAQHTISAVAAGRLRSRLNVPIVLNFLDYLTGFMETWPSWVMPKPLVGMLTRFEISLPRRFSADGVLTVSVPLAERFLATGIPPDRVRAIHYGFDAQVFRPGVPVPESKDPVVLMHGSFDEHHLGPIAREAVVRVSEARPDVLFRFVGRETPALRRFTREVRARNPAARLEFTGFIPYTEVSHQIGQATVGWVPYEESNGTHCAFVAKAVEYLGCAIPVASTPLENLRRYFADELAVKFSSGFEGASLAAAVLAWLEIPSAERQRLGRAASVRVARELDWSVVTRNAVDFAECCARVP